MSRASTRVTGPPLENGDGQRAEGVTDALRAWFGETPLTDPRSVAASIVFHAVLVVLASLAALSAVLPEEPRAARVLRGEVDSVDNRAGAQSAGGSPGEIGGEGVAEVHPTDEGADERGAPRDPSADALLAEILPTTPPSDAVERALPGPQTTGIGLLPGQGLGGGGGAGGGSGGGIGRGIGPGTEFFGAREHAHSFAYVIDCSGSMATRGSLDVAKRELTSSLFRLPPDARFAIVFYNLKATMFSDGDGHPGLMPATTKNKERVQEQLQRIAPEGGTDHMLALRMALALKPEVIFFLTDADLMSESDVTELLGDVGTTRIQAVRFGLGTNVSSEEPLRRLASSTGGTFRYIDVLKFPKPTR